MTTKEKLQEFLRRPLPPFKRGSADCCAFAANWAHFWLDLPAAELPDLSDKEARRQLLQQPLAERALEHAGKIGLRTKQEPADGDIIVFECPRVFGGKAIGIYSDGKGVTRMEGQKLFVHKDVKPEIILGL